MIDGWAKSDGDGDLSKRRETRTRWSRVESPGESSQGKLLEVYSSKTGAGMIGRR